jgi:lipopolysaccharide transport system permease protein
VRDISAQYRQSVLGYLWFFVPPLIAGLPFVYLNNQGITRFTETPIPYAAYAVIGTSLWQVFVDALNAPLRVVSAAKPMLTRINLPREAILLSGLAQAAFSAVIRLPLIIMVMLWFGIVPAPTAILFPVGIIALVLAGFTIGVLLTPLGMLYGDIVQALPVFTTFLMLLTPVVYPPPTSGISYMVATINPITPLVMATRDWLAIGTTEYGPGFAAVSLVAFTCLGLGWIILRVAMPHLVARAGN